MTRFPIDRISILLIKLKKYEQCIEWIDKYSAMEDEVGLFKGCDEKLMKRKAMAMEKLASVTTDGSAHSAKKLSR